MEEMDKIQQAFKQHGLPAYTVYQIDENEVLVCISWGDWKHDHLACDYVMKGLEYRKVQEIVTEENGSDCYSSEHSYIKKPN